MDTFLGYIRPDGRVGVRNKVLILPGSSCASDVASAIAGQVENTVTFHNQNGCAQIGPDVIFTMNVMAGYAANPNIYATVIVTLGCETCQMDLIEEAIKKRTNKPIRKVIIQEVGGTLKAVEKGVRYARELSEMASLERRVVCPASALIVGTECGGSDPTSGIASNPVIGDLSDRIVAAGGTTILSETTEFIGAEHLLAKRSATPEISRKLLDIVHRYEDSIKRFGEDVRSVNPSPGNIRGGITTLEEKSLGCIHKGGHTIVNGVYDYGEQINSGEGLVIMDTPGHDPSSVAAMVAGGAQVIAFSTGLGTPVGNPIAPVIKLTGNQQTFERMQDNLDFDASSVICGNKTISQLGEELYQLMLDVANGRLTKAEQLGFTEMAIARACNYM